MSPRLPLLQMLTVIMTFLGASSLELLDLGADMDAFLQSNFDNMRKMMDDIETSVMEGFEPFGEDLSDEGGPDDASLHSHFNTFTQKSCRCVNSECHCITDEGGDLKNLQDQLHKHVTTTCDCTNSKCQCVSDNGQDYTEDVAKMMALALRNEIQEMAYLQNSLLGRIQDFVSSGVKGVLAALPGDQARKELDSTSKLQLFRSLIQDREGSEQGVLGESKEGEAQDSLEQDNSKKDISEQKEKLLRDDANLLA